jgi:hypothetical protein
VTEQLNPKIGLQFSEVLAPSLPALRMSPKSLESIQSCWAIKRQHMQGWGFLRAKHPPRKSQVSEMHRKTNAIGIPTSLPYQGHIINTGTVPSKTLRETALALSGLKSRNLYGVDLSLRREVTVADFLGHEEHVKDAFHASITQRLQVLKATIYYGTCTFLDAHTIQVCLSSEDREKDSFAPGGEIQLRGEKILIATGSSPVHPDLFPFGHGEIYDSDTILGFFAYPRRKGQFRSHQRFRSGFQPIPAGFRPH